MREIHKYVSSTMFNYADASKEPPPGVTEYNIRHHENATTI